MARIQISNDPSGRIIVSFTYDPLLVAKVKTIDGRKWHKDEKYWSFPNSDGTLKKILEVFKDEVVNVDPAVQGTVPDLRTEQSGVPSPVIARDGVPKQSQFEGLRRELISRKYSYKTVKGYIYYNIDFLNFIYKNPSGINDSDIKDYLLYLVEERQSATSTLNQAINALKFYYGTMLKKKFIYEVRKAEEGQETACCSKQGRSCKNPQFGG